MAATQQDKKNDFKSVFVDEVDLADLMDDDDDDDRQKKPAVAAHAPAAAPGGMKLTFDQLMKAGSAGSGPGSAGGPGGLPAMPPMHGPMGMGTSAGPIHGKPMTAEELERHMGAGAPAQGRPGGEPS